MTLKTAIDLPAPTRVGGGLLSAARPLPDGWERGVLFNGSTCLLPQPWPYCLAEVQSPGTKEADTVSDVAEFEPVGIVQAVECTTLSESRAATMAMEALNVTGEYGVATELATGAETTNPSLADGATVATLGTGIVNAFATAEGVAADLGGRLAFYHLSPVDMARLVASQVVRLDGRTWRSPSGHVVVTSPGYTSLIGEVHVTGEVFASVSVPETRVDIDRAINQSTAYAEQIGMAAFDPCFNYTVEVT